MHTVDGKQSGGNERIVRAAEDPLCEHIQNRKDQYAEERARKSPSERRHAEDADADGNEQLAQRRMRPFIDRITIPRGRFLSLGQIQIVVLYHLIGGTGMVDLVEIHVIEIGVIQRDPVLLIQKLLRAVLRRIDGRRQKRVAVQNRNLVHGDRSV